MENATLINLSRQVALRRELNVISNNIANLGTSGFRAESTVFEEYLMPVAEMDMPRRADRSLSFVHDVATVRDYAPGQIQASNNPLDVAIEGDGWFVVQTPDGERYTRNGAFTINPQGQLVNNEGYPVAGNGGNLQFGPDDSEVMIARDGTVSTPEGDIGRLRIVQFETNMDLIPEGGNLFATEADALPAVEVRVQQGMIERSNVQAISEMSRMIEVTRAYESLVSNQRKMDDLRRDAINALSRMPT